MAQRIQFRRDTKANWQSNNPILLEGEIGYVTDDKYLYKMGDGTHHWNDLAWQGFNGNVVQEGGTSEDAVMSQKAVSEYVSVSQNTETGKTELLIGDTPALIVDNEPETGSNNLVKSGGVKTAINKVQTFAEEYGSKLSDYHVVSTDDLTLLGNAYMEAVDTKSILSNVNTSVYYIAVHKDKIYKLSSNLNWHDIYPAVVFCQNVPTIGGTYDEAVIFSAPQVPESLYTPSEDGYILLLYRDDRKATIAVPNEIPIPELKDEIDAAENNITAISSFIQRTLYTYNLINEGSLTSLGGGYMDDGDILSFSGSSLYYYPVLKGSVYKVSSELEWSSPYTAVAFSNNLPTIGGTYNTAIIMASAPETKFFIPPTNGYIILCYRKSWKSYIYEGSEIDVSELQRINSPLANKTIAILGDSIMQFMGGDVPVDTITLKNITDPTDPTIYQTSEASIVNGYLYLTSSLSDGDVTENSIRLEIVNSIQSTIDNWGWDYIKNKLGAADIINCGQGGGRVIEMGVITPYPCVTNDNLLKSKLQGLPNQVRMLKRLVSSNIRNTPDLIVIWMGINGTTDNTGIIRSIDAAMAIDWTTLSDDIDGFSSRQQFFGAMRYAVESLYREFPNAVIAIVSPVMTSRGNLRINEDEPAYRGFDDIKQCSANLKSVAERYSCLFFDALTQIGVANFAYRADTVQDSNEVATGVPLGNLIPTFTKTNDGLHPNDAGKIVWGNYLCRMLNSFYFDKA